MRHLTVSPIFQALHQEDVNLIYRLFSQFLSLTLFFEYSVGISLIPIFLHIFPLSPLLTPLWFQPITNFFYHCIFLFDILYIYFPLLSSCLCMSSFFIMLCLSCIPIAIHAVVFGIYQLSLAVVTVLFTRCPWHAAVCGAFYAPPGG